jgi:hypothetical protein
MRLAERPWGPLSAPGAWRVSEPRVTLQDLVERAGTIGEKLGLVVAWNMTGRPIAARRLDQTGGS